MANTRISNSSGPIFNLLLLITLVTIAGTLHGQQLPTKLPANKPADTDDSLAELITHSSEHFNHIPSARLDGLLQRIGDAQLVLLGEASHGTLEFYRMRARITRELIEKKGFTIVAGEADWPDASRINDYIREPGRDEDDWPAYSRKPFTVFPEWMWRNQTVMTFTRWLKNYNRSVPSRDKAVHFYGLDVYNLFGSIEVVLDYLYSVDAMLAHVARRQYRCLFPWSEYPPDYGRALKAGKARPCKQNVAAVYKALDDRKADFSPLNRQRYFDVMQNARLVINGERYFRTMNDGDTQSWNQRDKNMFERLQAVMDYHGEKVKAVVWAHNIHIGDSRATDAYDRGEINLGQRVREAYGGRSYSIGFGTDHGTVAAAPRWHKPVEIQAVPPSHAGSYEYLFHQVEADNFMLPLRHAKSGQVRQRLLPARMERAIGVAYDPQNELKKHYYDASLPGQFDEYIFFDNTHAVKPLKDVPVNDINRN